MARKEIKRAGGAVFRGHWDIPGVWVFVELGSGAQRIWFRDIKIR
jgi:hypothetical protein